MLESEGSKSEEKGEEKKEGKGEERKEEKGVDGKTVEKKETKSAEGGIRGKIKNSSKPELELIAFKLLDSLKNCKEQNGKLEKEKAELTKELEKNSAIIEQLQKDAQAAPETAKSEESSGWEEKERRRMVDDLEAAQIMCAELRSQLEDFRAEVATLRETRASADLFSLELADYEKKVTQLSKSLKEATEALELADAAKESLAEELSKMKEESGRSAAEGEKAKEDVDAMKRMTNEVNLRLAEMQLKVDEEKRKGMAIQEELMKERVSLGRQLASCQERANRMEEIVEALREENGRLGVEREAARTRVEELNKDYEAFKNRARYVLEQKKEQGEEEHARDEELRAELERKEKELAELKNDINILRDSQRRSEVDLSRANEQVERMEKEIQQMRREEDDTTNSLAKALDELRTLRVETERIREDAQTWRVLASEAEKKCNEMVERKNVVSRELKDLSEKSEEDRTRLEMELAEEKRRREELSRQLDERREKMAKSTPIAAVFPQLSDASYPTHSNVSPDALYGHPSLADSSYSPIEGDGDESPERGLESVLFGEDSIEPGRPIDEELRVEDPREEMMKMRIQLKWLREMHTESETAAANMAEQIKVLKEEIRRLQRNAERTAHVEENTEYLKNVIVKFISPEKVAGERMQLVPILQTMLRLSGEETGLLQRVAEGGEGGVVGSSGEQQSSSWGGLLPRWTGLS